MTLPNVPNWTSLRSLEKMTSKISKYFISPIPLQNTLSNIPILNSKPLTASKITTLDEGLLHRNDVIKQILGKKSSSAPIQGKCPPMQRQVSIIVWSKHLLYECQFHQNFEVWCIIEIYCCVIFSRNKRKKNNNIFQPSIVFITWNL